MVLGKRKGIQIVTASKVIRELAPTYNVTKADVAQPIFLQERGETVAVIISLDDYTRYQALLHSTALISAADARRLANRAIFGDLVGLALSCGEPLWVESPQPVWRIPYRLFDGTLVKTVEVDARSGKVALSSAQRTRILKQVQQWATNSDGTVA
jgi:PHD/YefM family antitoxin component YafN of YafNO toxin-antitoxin module